MINLLLEDGDKRLLRESAFCWRTTISRGRNFIEDHHHPNWKLNWRRNQILNKINLQTVPKTVLNLQKTQHTIKEKYGQIISIHSQFAMRKYYVFMLLGLTFRHRMIHKRIFIFSKLDKFLWNSRYTKFFVRSFFSISTAYHTACMIQVVIPSQDGICYTLDSRTFTWNSLKAILVTYVWGKNMFVADIRICHWHHKIVTK